MRILVASSSLYRQGIYRSAIENLGHEISCAGGGVECAQLLCSSSPDLLLLEAPLLWGGSEGVLETLQAESQTKRLPVVLVAVGNGCIDWFQLSRFRFDDVLFRIPTAAELRRAIDGVSERSASLSWNDAASRGMVSTSPA